MVDVAEEGVEGLLHADNAGLGYRSHEKNRVSNSKKPLFFYVNIAKAEVEMLEYNRLPGGDAAGPPDFFQGESSKWEAISDLDNFFERVYRYYCDKGFWCIVTQWIVELLTLAFTIVFSGFLLLVVNWQGLLHAECGVASMEKTGHDCNLYTKALYEHPLKPFSFLTIIVIGYLTIFSSYWLFCFLRFFTQLRETLEIRNFCHNSLRVSEHELQTMTWPMLVDKMVEMQHHQRLCIVKELSAHDIVSRIMRKDNYMIGLLNKGILALEVPKWLPGAGLVVQEGDDGRQKRLLLTKTVEWSLNWCILQNMFDTVKLMRGVAPHTQVDAEVAAGKGRPDNGPKLRDNSYAIPMVAWIFSRIQGHISTKHSWVCGNCSQSLKCKKQIKMSSVQVILVT